MMGSSGEPWGYYPQDSNGLAVQSALAEPCACPVFAPTNVAVCSPLVDGGCGEDNQDGSTLKDCVTKCRKNGWQGTFGNVLPSVLEQRSGRKSSTILLEIYAKKTSVEFLATFHSAKKGIHAISTIPLW